MARKNLCGRCGFPMHVSCTVVGYAWFMATRWFMPTRCLSVPIWSGAEDKMKEHPHLVKELNDCGRLKFGQKLHAAVIMGQFSRVAM